MDTTTHQTTIDGNILKFVRAYRNRVNDRGIQVKDVILFGSHATGKANSHSDIDLCVVSDQFGKDYHTEGVTLLRIAHEFDIPVDVDLIPFTPSDLNEKYDSLAKEIREHGIRIV